MTQKRWIDFASGLTLVVTLILFAVATIVHGFTRELLLEAGVFLISVKLVLSNFKTESSLRLIQEKLDRLEEKLK